MKAEESMRVIGKVKIIGYRLDERGRAREAKILQRFRRGEIDRAERNRLLRELYEEYGGEVLAESKNLVVNTGLQIFLDKLAEDIPGETATTGATHLWVGDGTTSPTTSDTDLASYQSEMALDDYSRSGQQGIYSAFFTTSDSNHTWAEVALANGPHGTGTMITRATFSSFTKTSSYTIRVDYAITLANA
ncbi:hypothetical protein [Candidatus Pyrohabitans sp.]